MTGRSSDRDRALGPAAFLLRVIGGSGSAERALPLSGALTIGRSRECDVAVNDAGISRRHAIVHVDPAELRLEDLGGANGTRVMLRAHERPAQESTGTSKLSARKLDPHESIALSPGDVFQLGATLFAIEAIEHAPVAQSIVVVDAKMVELYRLADQVAASPLGVLLLGETGVGKEILADYLVSRSTRKDAPFIKLNCGAFSESLLDAELFGHERGAFTGAVQAKPGLLESARGGSVFLDEVGELSPAMQVKLLRALEAREVLRVGGREPRPIDVRFIAATNRDLKLEVERGAFRGDLYFRLNGIALTIPPLRERPSEILPLAEAFVARACRAYGRAPPPLDEDARFVLQSYAWPGNLRELKHALERAVLLCGLGPIASEHLPEEVVQRTHTDGEPERTDPGEPADGSGGLHSAIADLERERILSALASCGGNQTRAAKTLGISRTTLVARLREYGVRRPRAKG